MNSNVAPFRKLRGRCSSSLYIAAGVLLVFMVLPLLPIMIFSLTAKPHEKYTSASLHTMSEKIEVLHTRYYFQIASPVEDTVFVKRIFPSFMGPTHWTARIGIKVEPRYIDRWLKDYGKIEGGPSGSFRDPPQLDIPWPCSSQPEYYGTPHRRCQATVFRKEGVILFIDAGG